MSDIDNIKENYKRMTVEQLKRLSAKPEDLRIELIPVLQNELLTRGEKDEALLLSEFLANPKGKRNYSDMTTTELRELINERLETGETLESIKMDLKDGGVDIFDVVKEENEFMETTFNYVTNLKQQGLDEEEIDSKLKENFSIEKEDAAILKVELRKSGKMNLIAGYTISTIALLIIGVSIIGGKISFFGIAMLITGIWWISRGYERIRK